VGNEPRAAYVVNWEAVTPEGVSYYGGARRVFADSAEDAMVRARAEIASDLQLAPESITILEARRMDKP
jgi:hypothetical protein